MGYSLTQLIGFAAVQPMVKTPVGGVPNIAPFEKMLAQTRPVEGLSFQFDRTGNSRQVAPMNDEGAPAKRLQQEQIETVAGKTMLSLNEIVMKQEILQALRSFNDVNRQKRAAELVEFQFQEFRRKHDNQRIAALCSLLTLGNIYLDAGGNLLYSSSGAKRTISGGLNYVTGTSTVTSGTGSLAYNYAFPNGVTGGDWSNAATDISKVFTGIQSLSLQNTGRPVRYCIFGANIPGYLASNTIAGRWQQGSSTISDQFSQGLVPNGFFDQNVQWIPGNMLSYKDASGSYRYWLDPNYILLLPEIDNSWFEVQEGTQEIAQTIGMFDDAPQAIQSGMATVQGQWGRCYIPPEPVAGGAQLKQFMGDSYMHCVKDANSPMLMKVIA